MDNLKNMRYFKVFTLGLIIAFSMNGCYDPSQKASEDKTTTWTGVEYAPQMYHSEPYDPLTQITDTTAGLLYFGGEPKVEERPGVGEFYNSNRHNPHRMNMRVPAENTVSQEALPYLIHKDSSHLAFGLQPHVLLSDGVTDLDVSLTYASLKDCEQMYMRFCSHCHGKTGEGDGKVGEKFGGVPMYASDAIKDKPIGYIYHVITQGKGRMRSHASQLSPNERWMIAHYVQKLQKQ